MVKESLGTHGFTIPLVVASAREEDRYNLESILADSAWQLFNATSLAAAHGALRAAKTRIAICDAGIDGECWTDTIQSFWRARPGVYVIFLIDDNRESLCREIGRHDNFDVLARPFQKEDVLRVLLFAYSRYRGTWHAPKLLSATDVQRTSLRQPNHKVQQ